MSRILKLVSASCEFSGKKSFFIGGSGAALGAGRAETNTTRMIFRLVASGNVSNRSIKVVLGALNDEFEVGALQKSRPASNRDQLRVLLQRRSKNWLYFGCPAIGKAKIRDSIFQNSEFSGGYQGCF